MAIKVGGTTVVDDSRQLTNIASVDATTVAALGAAGVGGGGTAEFTTDVTLTAGDAVYLKSSGNIDKISNSYSASAVGAQQHANTFAYPKRHSLAWMDNTYFIAHYSDSSNTCFLQVGSVSGTTVSFGSASGYVNFTGNPECNIVRGEGSDSSYALATVKNSSGGARGLLVTNSGTSLTQYTLTNIGLNDFSGGSMIYDTSQNCWVIVAISSGNVVMSKIARSGTSISIVNSTANFGSLTNYARDLHLKWHSGSSKPYLYLRNSSDSNKYYVYPVDTTSTPTLGTGTKLFDNSSYEDFNVAISGDDALIVMNHNSVNNGIFHGTHTINSSGVIGDITLSAQAFPSDYTGHPLPSQLQVSPDGFTVQALIASGGYRGVAPIRSTPSGYSLFKDEVIFRDSNNYYAEPNESADQRPYNTIAWSPDGSKLVIGSMNNGFSNYISYVVLTPQVTQASNAVGFAAEAISSGSTGKVNVLGAVDENQSSLNIGKDHWFTANGNLSSGDTGFAKAGRALSATTLLVKDA